MPNISRDDAWNLFCEWTSSESLRRHVLGVEACMRAYARRMGGDEESWAICGLVHDLDYERYPDLDTGHPRMAVAELERLGYPQEIVEAVAGHADRMGVPRRSDMARVLYAVDELSGFVAACAMVRPTGIEGMSAKSVRKKLRQPSFAAAIDRDQLHRAAEELEVEMGDHIGVVIEAMAGRATELGLAATQVSGGKTGTGE